jgi:dodecin
MMAVQRIRARQRSGRGRRLSEVPGSGLAIEEHFLARASPPGRMPAVCPDGAQAGSPRKENVMSVYRVTEVIGTSSTSWEDAAAEAIRTAAGTIRDLRVAEVVKQDIHLEEGGAITYRTKLQLSFKYEQER